MKKGREKGDFKGRINLIKSEYSTSELARLCDISVTTMRVVTEKSGAVFTPKKARLSVLSATEARRVLLVRFPLATVEIIEGSQELYYI